MDRLSASALRAYALAALFALVGAAVFADWLHVLRQDDLIVTISRLLLQPYFVACLVDILIGVMFFALFLFCRKPPTPFGLPPTVIAAFVLVLGNFELLWYMAHVLVAVGSVPATFIPETASTSGYREVPSSVGDNNGRKQSVTVWYLSAATLAALILTNIWAISTQPFAEGMKLIKSDAAMTFSVINILAGFLFAATFIAVREGLSWKALLWIIAIFTTGNMASCVYVMTIAQEALKAGKDFRSTFLNAV